MAKRKKDPEPAKKDPTEEPWEVIQGTVEEMVRDMQPQELREIARRLEEEAECLRQLAREAEAGGE